MVKPVKIIHCTSDEIDLMYMRSMLELVSKKCIVLASKDVKYQKLFQKIQSIMTDVSYFEDDLKPKREN